MIRFLCPKCGIKYEAEDSVVGARARCEECNTKMVIPQGNGLDYVVAQFADVQKTPQVPSVKPSEEKLVIKFDDIPDRPIDTSAPAAGPAGAVKASPRQRRLTADWKALTEHFSTFPAIHVKSYVGNPPEKYVVAYNVRGIERVDGERIVYRDYHEVEIRLPGTYPRTPPLCRMLTPIFHPNIEPAVICIGDHWTAAERLCDLIVRIGEMITFQAHNVKSPLDGEAAMWTDLHLDMLPVDSSDLTPPDL